MRLVIGGAYQGKTAFVMKKYGLSALDIGDGDIIDIWEFSKFRCVKNFHLFVKKILDKGEDPVFVTKKIISENPHIIIIMNEIGDGIIPMEKSERIWREQTGTVGCILAESAESVERIVCGICTKIK